MNRVFIAFFFFVVSGSIILLAQSIDLPHTFRPGDLISSEKINDNFNSLNARVSASMPVGSILPSMLTPAQFATEVGDPSTFNASVSSWALADNRNVSGSSYTSLTGENNLPDLRGMFLRGLNEGRSDGLQDPNGGGRAAGDYQGDQNRSHNHTNGSFQYLLQIDGLFTMFSVDNSAGEPNLRDTAPLQAEGGAEARPRNVSVYYYIKIN